MSWHIVKFSRRATFDRFAITLAAFTYAAFLVLLIPMNESIKDRVNYLEYASGSELIAVRYFLEGVLTVLSNEPIWLGVNISLGLFLSPEQVVSVIILFSAFLTSFLILKVDNRFFLFLLFFLFFPQVIGNYVIHLRQGLAISIFLLAWFSECKLFRYSFFLMTPFIHSSFFIVIAFLFFVSILKKLKLDVDVRALLTAFLGLVISFSLSYVAQVLGARQEASKIGGLQVSGLGFLFWFFVLVLFFMQGRGFCKKNHYAVSSIILYLSIYFISVYSGRIFESLILIVFIAALDLTSWRRAVFFTVSFCFFCLAWITKLDEFWLGFGTGL